MCEKINEVFDYENISEEGSECLADLLVYVREKAMIEATDNLIL